MHHGGRRTFQRAEYAGQPHHAFTPDKRDFIITYVVERMCNPDVVAPGNDGTGKASEGWCDLGTPKGGGKHTINEAAAFNFPPQPFYRVTVRVDGPQNTVSFLQAMLR